MTNDKRKQALLATYCAINSIDDFHKGAVTLDVTAITRNGIDGCVYHASIRPVHGVSSPPTVMSLGGGGSTEREALISDQYSRIVRSVADLHALIDAKDMS